MPHRERMALRIAPRRRWGRLWCTRRGSHPRVVLTCDAACRRRGPGCSKPHPLGGHSGGTSPTSGLGRAKVSLRENLRDRPLNCGGQGGTSVSSANAWPRRARLTRATEVGAVRRKYQRTGLGWGRRRTGPFRVPSVKCRPHARLRATGPPHPELSNIRPCPGVAISKWATECKRP